MVILIEDWDVLTDFLRMVSFAEFHITYEINWKPYALSVIHLHRIVSQAAKVYWHKRHSWPSFSAYVELMLIHPQNIDVSTKIVYYGILLLFNSFGKTSCERVRVCEKDVPLNE